MSLSTNMQTAHIVIQIISCVRTIKALKLYRQVKTLLELSPRKSLANLKNVTQVLQDET